MISADVLQFTFTLLLVGFILRLIQTKLAGTQIGNALSFIY